MWDFISGMTTFDIYLILIERTSPLQWPPFSIDDATISKFKPSVHSDTSFAAIYKMFLLISIYILLWPYPNSNYGFCFKHDHGP